MHDFHCKKADDMKSKLLADRAERDLETAVKLIEQGKMTEEEVAEFYHFTKAQMKLVKEKYVDFYSVSLS